MSDPVTDSTSGGVRSSFEIMGCSAPNMHTNQSHSTPGVGPTLSRPPSGMPDFGFSTHDDTPLEPEEPVVQQPNEQIDGNKPCFPFIVSFFLVFSSLLAMTATGSAIAVLKQIGRPVPAGYTVGLIIGIVVFVFGSAGLGHALWGPPRARTRVPRILQAFKWTISWPRLRLLHFRLPHLRFPSLRFPSLHFPRLSRPFHRHQSEAQSADLPHPKEFELGNLTSQRPRPPTPYPGLDRPSAQPSSQSRPETLPLGFPVPPTTGVGRMNSAVSRMSHTSFQSAPRSVSPLSDMPPTPPPKDLGMSRFQSRDPLIPPTASDEPVPQSDTRASILTTLCDAVQLPGPEDEADRAVQNYSPLGMASSPATGSASRDSTNLQSPKPTFPIELASPSRSREH